MSPILVLLTTAALGVEVGWQPLAEGGHEYIIQIEPQLLSLLERGTEEIASDVPLGLDVRRYRIRVGAGPVARDPAEPAAQPTKPAEPPPADFAPAEVPPQPEPERGAPESDPQARDKPEESAVAKDAAQREPAPAKLPQQEAGSKPIEQAAFDDKPSAKTAGNAAPVETQKPQLPDEPARPWLPLLGAIALLCCSLGANAYLGWVAWGARAKYRELAKLRAAL